MMQSRIRQLAGVLPVGRQGQPGPRLHVSSRLIVELSWSLVAGRFGHHSVPQQNVSIFRQGATAVLDGSPNSVIVPIVNDTFEDDGRFSASFGHDLEEVACRETRAIMRASR